MKKMIVFAFLFILGAGSVMAQKKTTKVKTKTTVKVKAPEAVKASFTSAYPDVTNASWSKTPVANYLATYTTEAGTKEEVEYNENGDVMKARTTYTESNLPVEIATGIQNKFAGATVQKAVKITLPGVAPYYNVKLKLAGEDAKEKNIFVSGQGLVSL